MCNVYIYIYIYIYVNKWVLGYIKTRYIHIYMYNVNIIML